MGFAGGGVGMFILLKRVSPGNTLIHMSTCAAIKIDTGANVKQDQLFFCERMKGKSSKAWFEMENGQLTWNKRRFDTSTLGSMDVALGVSQIALREVGDDVQIVVSLAAREVVVLLSSWNASKEQLLEWHRKLVNIWELSLTLLEAIDHVKQLGFIDRHTAKSLQARWCELSTTHFVSSNTHLEQICNQPRADRVDCQDGPAPAAAASGISAVLSCPAEEKPSLLQKQLGKLVQRTIGSLLSTAEPIDTTDNSAQSAMAESEIDLQLLDQLLLRVEAGAPLEQCLMLCGRSLGPIVDILVSSAKLSLFKSNSGGGAAGQSSAVEGWHHGDECCQGRWRCPQFLGRWTPAGNHRNRGGWRLRRGDRSLRPAAEQQPLWDGLF